MQRCLMCNELSADPRRCPSCGGFSFVRTDAGQSTGGAPTGTREEYGNGDDIILGAAPAESEDWEGWEGGTDSFLMAATGEIHRDSLNSRVLLDPATAAKLQPAAVLKRTGTHTSVLSPFEEHVLQFVNGVRPVARVVVKAQMNEEDVRIGLAFLLEKRAIALVGFVERPGTATEHAPAPVTLTPPPTRPAAAAVPAAARARPAREDPHSDVIQALNEQKRESQRRRSGSPAPSRARPAEPEFVPLDVQLFQQAQTAEKAGDFDEAVRLLQDAAQLNPTAATVYNRLGIILATRCKDYRSAIAALEHAADLEPNNQTIKNNLMKVLSLAPESASDRIGDGDGDPVRIRTVRPKKW